jgi:hypothetical protein
MSEYGWMEMEEKKESRIFGFFGASVNENQRIRRESKRQQNSENKIKYIVFFFFVCVCLVNLSMLHTIYQPMGSLNSSESRLETTF